MLWLTVSACAAPSSTASPPVSSGREAAYAFAVIRRTLLAVALLLLLPAVARAQDTGTYTSAALDVGVNSAWVDFDGDGRADYCRVLASVQIACTVSTGKGFGATYTSDPLDWGYATPQRMWGDVNGDHKADYCREVGNRGADARVACTFSTGTGFTEAGNTLQDMGAAPGSGLVDATGDGTADFCRVTGSDPYYATCSNGAMGTPFSSAALAPGADAGRAFVDFTGDGKADFCRVTTVLACAVSSGSGFSSDIASFATDLGYAPGRAWADVNGDGKADYCRRVGNGGADARIGCTLSTGSGFGELIVSDPVEWGSDAGYAWSDFDHDGDRDFCRVVPGGTSQQLFCTLWTPNGLSGTIVSGPVDAGVGGVWVDHNGDGRGDYCRQVESATKIACTISNGVAFGPLPDPATPQPPVLTPVRKTRIVVTLAFDYVVKGRYTRLTRIVVNRVPRGATVKATCKKGCSRKSYTKKNVRGGKLSLKPMARKRLKAGTTIKVVVSQTGKLSATKTFQHPVREEAHRQVSQPAVSAARTPRTAHARKTAPRPNATPNTSANCTSEPEMRSRPPSISAVNGLRCATASTQPDSNSSGT